MIGVRVARIVILLLLRPVIGCVRMLYRRESRRRCRRRMAGLPVYMRHADGQEEACRAVQSHEDCAQ